MLAYIAESRAYLNQTGTRKHLHNHTRSNNRGDTQLHDGATVGSQNHTHPVKGIRGLGGLNSIDGNLTANKENEKRNGRPKELFAKGDLQQQQGRECTLDTQQR
jgi:hypothetical protein